MGLGEMVVVTSELVEKDETYGLRLQTAVWVRTGLFLFYFTFYLSLMVCLSSCILLEALVAISNVGHESFSIPSPNFWIVLDFVHSASDFSGH